MQPRLSSLLATTCLTVVAAPARSQAPTDSSSVAGRVARYLEPMAAAGALSGVVLLARGDTVLYHGAFGWADRPGGRRMTVNTASAVASISKPLTGIIVAGLVAQGRLSLEDRLSRWLTDFPSADRITIDMLMSHRAGVRHRVTQAGQEGQARTAASMVPLIAAQPLLFEPGSRRVYSSMGYVVLARVLELSGQKPYWQLLDEMVLRPAGTAHSADATQVRVSETVATSFFQGADGLIQRPRRDLSFLVGAGSLYSTPADLFAVFRTLAQGRYGSAARDRHMRGNVFWSGLTDGYRAFLQHDSASRVTLVFTTNSVTGVGDMIQRDLPRIAGGETMASPALPRPEVVALSPEAAQRISGEYQFQSDLWTPLEFVSPKAAFAGDYLLLPTSDSTFFSVSDYAQVRVTRAADGSVSGLQWGEGGPSFPRRGPSPRP